MFVYSLNGLRGRRAALVIGFAAAIGCRCAGAETLPPLTIDAAIRLAEERSLQLPAQDAAAAAARAMAVAAGQLPPPTLKAGINNLPVNGADRFNLTSDFMTMRSIGLMQEFVRDDKRQARAARFERDADVAAAGRAATLADLQRDTALAWIDRYVVERRRVLIDGARDEAERQVAATETAYRSGRGAQADVFAAKMAVAQIDDRRAQLDRQRATATTQLARWIGAAAAQQPLGELPAIDAIAWQSSASPSAFSSAFSSESPFESDSAFDHHPQIAVLAKREAAALADAQVARAERKSDWSVELMYSQRGAAYSNMVSINFSMPLPWGRADRQDRELAAKLSVAEQIRAEREEAVRAHRAEVDAMVQEWQSDRARLVRYDQTLAPLARERLRAATAAYRGGTGTLSAVLEARRSEIDVSLDRLQLERETARLWAQLNFLAPTAGMPAAVGRR